MNTAAPTRISTTIDAWDIRVDDVLIIDRNGHPAEVTVANVEKGQNSVHEHAGANHGGERRVAITTTDGAVLVIDEGGSGEDGYDEIGDIERVSEDETAAMLSDVHYLRSELVSPDKPVYEREHYRDYDYEEDEDLSRRQRAALSKILDFAQVHLDRSRSVTPKKQISASAVRAIRSEVSRERSAIGALSTRLSIARDTARFPKSRADWIDRAILHTSEASSGTPTWITDTSYFSKDWWPAGSQVMLAQDWADANRLSLDDGPRVPYARLKEAMDGLRALRATAIIAADLASELFSVKSMSKALSTEFASIIAELERIAAGRTAIQRFTEHPEDPWNSTSDELSKYWYKRAETPGDPYFFRRLENALLAVVDEDNLREVLISMIKAKTVDIEDVPLLICAELAFTGRSHAGVWPVPRHWLDEDPDADMSAFWNIVDDGE